MHIFIPKHINLEFFLKVESMFSTACHLSKTFNDYPAARRISDTVKQKIEKFRTHLPVLHTLCNPGLRERHWKAISEANGAPVKYDDSTRYVHIFVFI